jgi:phage-related protein
MFIVDYYTTPRGEQPVREWLVRLSIDLKAIMSDRIIRLEEYGLELLATEMMKKVKDDDPDFYELRGGQGRILFWHDRQSGSFILLHGFRKKRQLEKREIETGRRRLHRYFEERGS